MDARKNDSQDNDQQLSTTKITTFFHDHNKSKEQFAGLHNSNASLKQKDICITKSYCPNKPPTFSQDEKAKFAENYENICTDGNKLRFDERRQMYYYPSKDDAEDSEEINSDSKRSCAIL